MLQPELKFRRDKIRYLMAQQGIDAALIACNVNLLYTYGEIVNGYLYLPLHSPALLFVKRPNNIVGEFVFPIRKPEQIVDLLKENGIPVASKIMLEGGELPYADYMRLASLFPESEVVDGTAIIREARSVKTPLEIELFRRSAALHARAYSKIPDVYHPGMTDRELSVEVERLMRLEGCLGIFRVFGQSMEIFMGSVLAGDNAATPSPYDFALGGKGLDPSLPGGMNGTLLKEGYSVMVDIGGNFYGYMCDMSRVFSIGKLNDEAYAGRYVETYMETKSRRRMEDDLRRKGVDRSCIEEAFCTVQEADGLQNEEAMIKELLRKKHFDAKQADLKEKRRIQAFLYRKGFSPDKIRKAMNCDDLEEGDSWE